MIITLLKFQLVVSLSFLLTGCYSFTGSSLHPEVKTIKISPILNHAPLINLSLSNNFTNSLTDRFDQRTNLTLTNNNDADITIEGEITKYQLGFTNIGSSGIAAQNRLTISVKITYQNTKEPLKNFQKTFEDFQDFDSQLSLANVEDSLVPVIIEKLIDGIFNTIVSDW